MAISKKRMAFRVFLVLVLAGTCILGYQGWRRSQPDYLKSRARQALEDNNVEVALLSLQTAVQKSPDDAEAHRELGMLLLQLADSGESTDQGLLARAAEHLAAAWKLNPEDQAVGNLLLDCHLRSDRTQEAEQLASDLLEVNENAQNALMVRARRHLRLENYQAAERLIDRLDALEESSSARLRILQTRLHAGQDNAEKLALSTERLMEHVTSADLEIPAYEQSDLENALRITLQTATSSHEVGDRFEALLGWLAAKIAPAQPELAARRALQFAKDFQAHEESGQFDSDRAGKLWNRVREMSAVLFEKGEPAIGLYREASLLATQFGDGDWAISLMTEAIRKFDEPNSRIADQVMELRLHLARQLIVERRYKSAAEHVQILLEDPLYEGWAHLLAGSVAISEQRFESALQHLEGARKKMGSKLIVRVAMARTLIALKKWGEALPYLASLHVNFDELPPEERSWAIENLGTAEDIHMLQAQANLAMGNEGAALHHLNALRETKLEPRSIALYAAYLWNRNDRSRAMAVLHEGRLNFPDNITLKRLEGTMLLKQGRSEKSQNEIARLADEHPNDFSIQMLVYQSLLQNRQREKGLIHLEDMISQFPERENAILLLKAKHLLDDGNAAAALEVTRQLSDSPETAEAADIIGAVAALRLQNLDQAASILEQAAQSEQRVGALNVLQANVSMAQGDYESAVESFSDSLQFTRLRGMASRSLLRSLVLLSSQTDPGAVETKLRELLNEYPDEPSLVLAHAELQAKQGNFSGAMRSLDRLEKLTPDSTTPGFVRARLWHFLNRPERALQELERLIRRSSPEIRSILLAANVSLANGEPNQALAYLELGSNSSPKPLELTIAQSVALRELGRWDEAQQVLESVVQDQPQAIAAFVQLADLHHRREQPEQAIEVLANGRAQNPQSLDLLQASIRYLCNLERQEAAEQLAQEAAGMEPSFPVAFALGRGFLLASAFEPAKHWANVAAQLADDQPRDIVRLLQADIAYHESRTRPNAQHLVEEARLKYSAVLDKNPNQVLAATNLASLLLDNLGDAEAVTQLAERLSESVPLTTWPDSLIQTVYRAHEHRGDLAAARSMLFQASRLQSRNPRWLLSLVQFSIEMGETERILDELDQFQQHQRWLPYASFGKARVWAHLRHPHLALTEAETALQIDPDYTPARLLAAELSLSTGEHQAAVEHAEQLLKQDPEQWTVYHLQARALRGLDRRDEAQQLLEDVIGRLNGLLVETPSDVNLRIALSQFYQENEQTAEALAVLTEGREHDAENRALGYEVVQLLANSEQPAEAATLADEVFSETSIASDCLRLGRLFHSVRELDTARIWAEKALALAATNEKAAAHWLLGDLYLAVGQTSEDKAALLSAADHYRAVLSQRPRHLIAGNNLAWILAHDLDQPLEALEVVEQVRGTAPPSQLHLSFVDTLSLVYRRTNRLSDARQLLETVVSMHPTEAALHFELGQIYFASDHWDAAQQSLTTALDLGLDDKKSEEALALIGEIGKQTDDK